MKIQFVIKGGILWNELPRSIREHAECLETRYQEKWNNTYFKIACDSVTEMSIINWFCDGKPNPDGTCDEGTCMFYTVYEK